MEPIKVSINVNLSLSDEAKSFISNIVTNLLTGSSTSAAPAPKPAASAAAPAPKPAAAPAPKPAAASAPKPAASAAPAENNSEISIEDVRKALSLKVSAHRSEIKDKLTELGAPSVTKLDPSLYEEMLDFLNTLD